MARVRESSVDRAKRIAKVVARRQVDAILRLREAMGIHPWEESGEMSPQERIGKFILIQDDELFWNELAEIDRRLFHLEAGRVPIRLWRESVSLYRKAQDSRMSDVEAATAAMDEDLEEGADNNGVSY